METKPPLPPFTLETAKAKVQAAEDAWNTRDPERVALAYTEDSQWRNRAEFFSGREEIKAFLRRKWAKELDYRLRKNCGVLQTTGFLFASSMSGTMILATGIAPMVMNSGNLPK